MEKESSNPPPQEPPKQVEEKQLTADDVEPFNQFICSLTYSLLSVDREVFYKQIHESSNQQIIMKFAQHLKHKILIISKPQESEDIEISIEVNASSTQKHSIAFIKRQTFAIVEGQSPTEFTQQIQILNLGYYGHDISPISINHLYVQNCFIPIFNAYKNTIEQKSSSEKDSYQVLLKKVNELNLALIQCQQSIEVPEIQLHIEPAIKQRVAELKTQGKKIGVEEFEDLVTPEFIEILEQCVNKWTRDVSTVIQISSKYDISNGTTLQEINYWQSYERSLNMIEQQIKVPEVDITIQILENKNKFKVTSAWKYDLNFGNSLDKCSACNAFTKDFPLNELLSSHELDELQNAIKTIFNHMKKIVNYTDYTIERGFQLLEALSKDLNAQTIKILRQKRLITMPAQEFIGVIEQCDKVFQRWESDYQEFRDILRRHNLIRFKTQYINHYYEHVAVIKPRITKITEIRRLHEKLKNVIQQIIQKEKISGKNESSFLNNLDIQDSYSVFYELDVLDVSKDGEAALVQAQKQYELRIDKVESSITSHLIDKLGLTENANEMFRIFAKFNALFFRPKIKGAIQQYQAQLLQTVQKDIETLQKKFLQSYNTSQNSVISKVRDIPQTSGSVIWAKQISRRLDKYLQRVENVLGKDWHEHADGRKCKEIGEAFKQRLDIEPMVQNWTNKIQTLLSNMNLQERIFDFEQKKKLNIIVNFDRKMISLYKEIRMMGKIQTAVKFNYSIKYHSDDVQVIYPYAVSLQESVHSYNQISSKIDDKMTPLVAKYRWDIHTTLEKGMGNTWSMKQQLSKYIKNLSDKVLALEEAVGGLNEKNDQINAVLATLKGCQIEYNVLRDKLETIQKIIDDFSLKNYSNLNIWVDELDKKIESILCERLVSLIKTWNEEFVTYKNSERNLINCDIVHELKIQDSIIHIEPPIDYARYYWMREFHKMLGTICALPRLEANRYDKMKEIEKREDQDYSSILHNKIDPKILQGAYRNLDNVIRDAEKYVETWLSYSSLWKIDVRKVYEELGDNIEDWQQLLNEIKSGRKTFDNDQTEIYFGGILVDYRLVQAKINNKYDQWHKEILNHFGETFQEKLRGFYKQISQARTRLEKINFQNIGGDLMAFITDLKQVKEDYQIWNSTYDSFKSGQKLLDRQRYQQPNDWLCLEQVDGEWSSFKQVLNRKYQSFEKESSGLQNKIIADENALNEKIKEIEEMWNQQKPYSGDLMPNKALDILNIIEQQLDRVNNDYIKCCKCKELLNLEPGNPERLEDLSQDIQGLREVWVEMQKVWQHIDVLKDQLVQSANPKAIKESTEKGKKGLEDLPIKLKSYEAYEKMSQRLKDYGKMNQTILDLKSEAMKPRHWKEFIKKIKLNMGYQDITLENLWEKNLLKYERQIGEVLTVATGELVLENMLGGIKETWNNYELELVRYQSKCKLIRGWEDLFNQLDEDINNLASMKNSPYYKAFQEEIEPWDDKLQRYKITLDIWMDVQRRWVYLESIFFGSSDIKQQLSSEFTRFKGIDNEFVGLHKKVAHKPLIHDAMSIMGLQKSLERLADLLAKIQKALGEYLEMQRQAFARFYFLGDEDLLEIIGNSKDVKAVQRHFNKMYAGITSLTTENKDGQDLLYGMHSKEGEYVTFDKNVNITEDPRINIWLSKVDEQMMVSLASFLEKSLKEITSIQDGQDQDLLSAIEKYPAQVILLGLQVLWCTKIEDAFGNQKLEDVVQYIVKFLSLLATSVVKNLKKDLRQKFEQIITDFVHQRDVSRELIQKNIQDHKDFAWQYHMRFYWQPKEQDVLKKLQIRMARAQFEYGFEYLGVAEKLVQTPLTDRCYLTLTQALHLRMGGNPFGPAGTGKTESVKALGSQLGQFVLVFNCDETFDFHAMGRIFVGLCQVGAWGCFDEFNRLEERMLSAVSQQILIIQQGLRERQRNIALMNRDVKLNFTMGIFVTMNPGYAGRSNLPENLKQLFRQMAMVKPDRELIAQVMLYSQGFSTAERLAGKIVSLFELCSDQLSSQPHYDFGLRSLKAVLVSSGNMKREELMKMDKELVDEKEIREFEQKILLRSVCETIVPKLIADDVPLLSTLLSGVFPGSSLQDINEEELTRNIKQICKERHYLCTEPFLQKMLQLYQIQRICHGNMMVGPSGSGKSAAWKILLEAMYRVDKVQGQPYIIDPKAIHKDDLYGRLDNTTMEWTDGVFTGVLRKITENQRGESSKRHWIIFDGDVDPEWAENLNSVLDDNKLLTLPNGERISIPPNVRIMFEVETLKYATLATVSRCGMVWFSDDLVTYEMMFHHYLNRLQQEDFDYVETDPKKIEERIETQDDITRKQCVEAIQEYFTGSGSFGQQCIEIAAKHKHVMDFTIIRVVEGTFALIRKAVSNVIDFNESHSDMPLEVDVLQKYMKNWTLFSICWGISGSMTLRERQLYSDEISQISPIQVPPRLPGCESIIDYEVSLDKDGEWVPWKKKVPTIEIDPQKVTDADLIITTVDTLRHQEVLCSWLSEHRPFLLCGPPGSGKTMTLMSTLKQLPDFEMIFVNFSSGTTPSLILKQFDHYCEYVKTTNGIVLRPKQLNKWLVVFCDEINLPEQDKYSTMAVITFLRELTEQKGFWRPTDKQWVTLDRIQFIGACNPPTDVGRNPLNPRFLRHCPLILVDFPGVESLKQIYGTFNRAMMKRIPHLRQYADPLTNAMVEFYHKSQNHFTSDIQSHYIYSPRELTRWKFAINEAIDTLETPEQIARLWAHEALRLFYDRLVKDEEKEWCEKLLDEVAFNCFPNINPNALERPILYSKYLTKNYESCEREELRQYIQARMRTFNEEQLDVKMVVFDSVIDHILRIDRVLRQPLGHLLLVGSSGVGKTTLSRFVSWMNNLTVFQIKAGRKYSLVDFDVDLREVMKRAGVKGEKITFIFDESNVLSPAFLEKMNALLASGEIPGLFEGEEYMALMSACKEAATKENKMVDTDDQIYRNFIKNVQRNLHVVFTMNPNNPDFSNRTASSPALFNRCVIDWFGDWSQEAFLQVAQELTKNIDPDEASFTMAKLCESFETKNAAVVGAITYMHNSVAELNESLKKSAKKFNYITTRDFLDFIKHFEELFISKSEQLADQQRHLNVGLDKLKDTEQQVIEMQATLSGKQVELDKKEKEASEKLKLMVNEKSQAESSKEKSIVLSEQVEQKKQQIQERSVIVQADLDNVLPMLEKAKNAVSNIKADDLKFIKSLATPPRLIQLTMEAVVSVVRNTAKDWKWPEIKKEISDAKFVKTVMEFNTDNLKNSVRQHVDKQYLNSKEWVLPNIYRASAAAGPLAEWVDSQLKFGRILEQVEPLRNQVKQMEKEEKELTQKKIELDTTVDKLEAKIEQLRVDYDQLTSQKERIKSEMEKVLAKVERSQNLLKNLSSERYRWDESCHNFKEQQATIIGDTLLAGAFSSYIGFFDHYYRRIVTQAWRRHLEHNAYIKFRKDLEIVEYLSLPSQRLNWQTHGLPSDNLCTENAIILNRFKRYPLIIDPSGQALKFVLSFYRDKKITTSSFADEGFIKNLETCLRFGFPLLVQDVEKIDPILNSVLNKESYKTGGRVLIRVGDQEIDFSPNFQMFMITRDSNARFTPDLCSRVTFVNFTVTRSSLENQCLNLFMQNETPETEKDRIQLMKLQGEYIVRLRELEDKLLDSLNSAQGSILENEQVISTLETLKTEAQEVTKQMKESDKVMAEVQKVTDDYRPLASACSSVFFALADMGTVHYLYEFSLNFFMDIFNQIILQNQKLNQIPKNELKQRRQCINDELFVKVYERVSNSILVQDRMILSMKLCQIKLGPNFKKGFETLLRDSQILESSISPQLLRGKLSKHQLKLVEELSNQYSTLLAHISSNEDQWYDFIEAVAPETCIPEGWEPQQILNNEMQKPEKEKKVAQYLRSLQLIKAFRPDRFNNLARVLIEEVMGQGFLNEIQIDMKHIAEKEASPKSPLLMCSSPGFDPSFRIEHLSRETGVRLITVAIGSQEGFVQAEKAIQQASKNGVWVMFKNVHLAPGWLNEVEKTIHSIQPHPNFRLFLTMEFNPKVPSTLIRQCYKLVFEPPNGIKASLSRTYKTLITPAVSDKQPRERARLHFLLAWIHAVLLERLRYTPTGYTKTYEFNEADQRCALDLIDEYVDSMGERSNIDPNLIPWDAIKTILTHNLYGAKIDNDYDGKILKSLVDNLFTPKAFDPNYSLFTSFDKDVPELKMPEAIRQSQFLDWIENLPATESPIWSGLPLNVEKILKEQQAQRILSILWSLQDVNEEEVQIAEPEQPGKKEKKETQLQWLKELNVKIDRYLEILPQQIKKAPRDKATMNNPLFRFLEREITVAQKVLKLVLANLQEMKQMCEGTILPSAQLRHLAHEVYSDNVPAQWLKQSGLNLKVNEWVIDFKKKIDQFQKLSENPSYQKSGVDIGMLIYPEAFMTATRQYVCEKHGWSLEELELSGKIYQQGAEVDDDSFLVNGMNVEGAKWDKNSQQLQTSNEISTNPGSIVFTWIKVEKGTSTLNDDEIMVPVYMNKFRKQLIFSLKMNCGNLSRNVLYQKAIALSAWNE